MNYYYLFGCIFCMALITYLTRMIPLVFMKRKIHNRFIRSFLQYVPYAVLAAMTVPDVFFSTANPISAAVGVGVALLLAGLRRGLMTVALGAVGAVFLAERLLAFCLPF